MLMIFEDDKDMPISLLFRKIYNSNVIFTSGNGGLENNIENNIGSMVYCYIDVVPDNIVTVRKFTRLLSLYEDVKTVNIIPIPCIEYIALLVLYEYGYFSSIDIQNILYVSGKSSIYVKYSDSISFEKYCKDVLNSHDKKCIHNGHRQRKEYGAWYISDCPCTDYKKCQNRIELQEKIVAMLLKLPVFVSNIEIEELLSKYNKPTVGYLGNACERYSIIFKRIAAIKYDS